MALNFYKYFTKLINFILFLIYLLVIINENIYNFNVIIIFSFLLLFSFILFDINYELKLFVI